MPVMNIFLQLRVCFNMLFVSGEKQAPMWSAGVGEEEEGGGASRNVSAVSSRDKTQPGVGPTTD